MSKLFPTKVREYSVRGRYNGEAETVYSSNDRIDADARLKEYRENERGTHFWRCSSLENAQPSDWINEDSVSVDKDGITAGLKFGAYSVFVSDSGEVSMYQNLKTKRKVVSAFSFDGPIKEGQKINSSLVILARYLQNRLSNKRRFDALPKQNSHVTI